jgi:hypothetical protein
MRIRWVSACIGLCTFGFAASHLLGGANADTKGQLKIQGVLIDEKCSPNAQTRVVTGLNTHLEGGIVWAYTHTRKCALMPECQRSGYGLATHDDRYLKFDAAGNRKAAELLRASTKEDDLEVEVTGEVQGDSIRVVGLTWQ